MTLRHTNPTTLVLSLFLLLVVALVTPTTKAGTLDPAFGTGGMVSTDISFDDTTRKVFALSDGKTLMCGHAFTIFMGFYGQWPVLARYNSNGTLDTSFGNGGKVFGDGSILVKDVLLQPDGKIIVVGGLSPTSGLLSTGFELFRYTSGGVLDSTFGTGGKVSTQIGSLHEMATTAVLLADGKILALGGTEGDASHAATIDLARYNADGSLDGTFGTGGTIAYPYAASGTQLPMITGSVLLPGGQVLARGPNIVARFNANGSFDTTFDGDGMISTDSVGSYLTLLPDGKFIVGGSSELVAGGNLWRFRRYNSDGTLDSSFGVSGLVQTDFRVTGGLAGALIGQVIVKGNGEILAVGTTTSIQGDHQNFALAQYTANGALIAKTGIAFAGNSHAVGVAVQADDKIIVGGFAKHDTEDFAIARLSTITNDFFTFRRNYDFNGDGRDDLTVYRTDTSGGPSHWYSSSFFFPWFTFGSNGDVIAPGDYNGDGIADLAVFRPNTGYWYISNSLANAGTDFRAIPWGTTGDVPAAGDYDGDGKADVAVFRPSNGGWYILESQTGGVVSLGWGTNGDIPVVGDYDGDGKADIAVFRPSTGGWYVLKSSDGQVLSSFFGANGDRPVAADYDGDGITDIAVFRPSTGVWYRLNSSNGAFVAIPWGVSGDVPAPGDFDGDGKTDLAVFRAGNWYILRSSSGALQSTSWGLATDTPVPGN